MSQDQELLDLVKTLSGQVKELEKSIKSLKQVNAQDVPEEVLVAIAAGVAAYLGYRGLKRQARFTTPRQWVKGTRSSQLNHTPER
jgi:methylmalonyl-CoA carboxyltransferase large subunit